MRRISLSAASVVACVAVSVAACDNTADDGFCVLTEATVATDVVEANGCAVLDRDVSACAAEREAAGLRGPWLRYSCRVGLAVDGDSVVVATDDLPDHESNYFENDDACHEDYDGAVQNPNHIAAQDFTLRIPLVPDTNSTSMRGLPAVGVAADGVVVFSNEAAPGDDIYNEAQTFDRCGAHPQNTSVYHYHGEPYAISFDDGNWIGTMLDGYPIYGRRDPDGSVAAVDEFGGHTGTTIDSDVAVYHYHVNEQTSSNEFTAGQKQFFLTTGTLRGSPGSCDGCDVVLP